ncbi:MAG: zf-TFIIB domain-containing protein, partial [Polyangiaceae bacterium]|nr:zf-TFIIB domain-containing protein [Polyangiaceae bacterium]
MSEAVICLGCGGVVTEGAGIPAGEAACSCVPPAREAPTVVCRGCGGSLAVGVRACPFCGSTAATRRCAHCSAWTLSDAVHCQQCGRGLAEAPDGPCVRTGDPCPRCGHGLAARRYAELDVDECDGCGGLMLTPATMDRLVATRDTPTGLRMALPKRAAAREERVVYLRCPACQKSMNRRAFGRIS